MESLEQTLKKEHHKAKKYLNHKKPFKYIEYLKKKYGVNIKIEYLIEYTLEDYLFLKNNGVKHQIIYFALKRLATSIIENDNNKNPRKYY